MTLHQGDCITLTSDENLYQVIGVDDRHNRSVSHQTHDPASG
jgi:hypothetical protein